MRGSCQCLLPVPIQNDHGTAIEWIKSTYLYVRMLRNPAAYGVSKSQAQAPEQLEKLLKELVLREIAKLGNAVPHAFPSCLTLTCVLCGAEPAQEPGRRLHLQIHRARPAHGQIL